jgi:two-component system OmpR family sensor kinase
MAAALALVPWWRIRRERAARGEAVLRACHELRGPLTAVRLGVELGRRTGGLSEVHWRAMEGELDRAAVALGDLQLAPAGKTAVPELRAVDLRALLADSVEAWRPCADAAGVQLDMRWAGGHSRVRGDRVRLAQATGNLIANAIEHGGARVQVRGRRWGGGARIEVSDDGPGLPATVTRLTRGSRRRGSRGRGLAIVAGVAEAHGGHLAVAPGGNGAEAGGAVGEAGGTCLVLELPDGAARRS